MDFVNGMLLVLKALEGSAGALQPLKKADRSQNSSGKVRLQQKTTRIIATSRSERQILMYVNILNDQIIKPSSYRQVQ